MMLMKKICASLPILGLVSVAGADVAFDNFGPGNTFTGSGWLVRGPLASPPWTHAFPFTAQAGGEITRLTVALHHLSATNLYTFEIRADAGGVPGASLGNLGQVSGFTSGSVPVQFTTNPGVVLTAGTTYWLYGRGLDNAQGTWRQSPTPGGTRAYSFDQGATWTVATISPPSGMSAFRIEVQPAGQSCYANCDGSTAVPFLNVADFTCFLQRFAAGDPYANCDGSTTPPVLNVADFTCFLQAFAAGCSAP